MRNPKERYKDKGIDHLFSDNFIGCIWKYASNERFIFYGQIFV